MTQTSWLSLPGLYGHSTNCDGKETLDPNQKPIIAAQYLEIEFPYHYRMSHYTVLIDNVSVCSFHACDTLLNLSKYVIKIFSHLLSNAGWWFIGN